MKKKNSTEDWDFSTTDWSLDTSKYVSSPSSLRITLTTALVKTTVIPIADVKEGKIITYIRFSRSYQSAKIIFRYQDDNNYYYVKLYVPTNGEIKFEIHRLHNGSDATLQSATQSLALNTWHRIRVTWWNDYVGLAIRVEYWNDDKWKKACADAYDANNYWKDVGGRVGIFGDYYSLGYYVWFDDTYIYGIS